MWTLGIISGIASKMLQSLEFFRSGFGRYFTMAMNNVFVSKFLLIPIFIYSAIRMALSLFGSFCSSVSGYLSSIRFNGVVVGGVNVLSLANSVLPLDETIALVIVWFTIYATCASIRFVRAAWSAIPFKAT